MTDSRTPPNIVVVLADDMGWGDLGCYGSAIPTPQIDRLAGEGVRATNCHSASAVCTPSRYALMTGRYAWRGPLKNFVLMGHGPALIEPSRPTLASVLKRAGYATGAFGKWHLGLGWRHTDGSVRDAFAPGGVPVSFREREQPYPGECLHHRASRPLGRVGLGARAIRVQVPVDRRRGELADRDMGESVRAWPIRDRHLRSDREAQDDTAHRRAK